MRPEEKKLKEKIEKQIQQFQTGDFMTNAEKLFATLGYASERRAKIDKDYLTQKGLNQEKALFQNWQEAGLICQVTGEDMSAQSSIFQNQFEDGRIRSYLFYAIELKKSEYPRGALAQITRYVNKLFPMPVFILFKYGAYLTLAIIDRRQHKKEESKDVLEKVTLIRNIFLPNPHRAHLEILFDLSYQELQAKYRFTNFEGLHQAWQKTLDTKELNKKFYRELSAWYFYAKSQVLFPDDVEKDTDKRNSINLIRLITRLIFVWFIKEKDLIPEELFDEDFLKEILDYSDKTGSTYYKAILQNLFFATLNLEMNKDKPGSRAFVTREDGFHSQQHLMPAYRYARFFKNPDQALSLFENIPFLNGGLFENLDFETEENGKRVIKRIDCFSDHPDNETKLKVPDALFFSDMQRVDLSSIYEDKKHKSEEFRGIINIFKRYKFTIEENTPIEEEIALDPELLGKVFENLLASYNPETHTTARKATGSFYTPREIVDYMVDESLVAYLETQLKNQVTEFKDVNDLGGLIRDTLSYTEKAHPFTKENEVEALINAIDNCKILDPACGSGAFPMGILHKLVYLLHKLDPQNERWMNRQIRRVKNAIREVEKNEDVLIRENLIRDLEKNIESIEDAFLNNELDYGRKLYLIENCIYGVDIQPIAIQIAKLRFFISLVIDQKIDPNKPNRNIRALPNLETKFVAANTLIELDKPAQVSLRNREIDRLESELKEVRKNHFSARSRKEKIRLRNLDEKLRNRIASLLIADGWYDKSAKQLADWNPYNQNTSSLFFDPEWMLGIEDGFDIVIGNPPYVEFKNLERDIKDTLNGYKATRGKYDLYIPFLEKSQYLLKSVGIAVYICPTRFMHRDYGEGIRNFMSIECQIIEIVDFADIRIFEGVTNYTGVFLFAQKQSPTYSFKYKKFHNNTSLSKDDFIDGLQKNESTKGTSVRTVGSKELGNWPWYFGENESNRIIEKIRSAGKALMDNCMGIYQGIATGKDDVFILNDECIFEWQIERRLLQPFLKGKDISRYSISWSGKHLLYPYDNEGNVIPETQLRRDYPKAYAYLLARKSDLAGRNYFNNSSKKWFELWNQRRLDRFKVQKIITLDNARRNSFALDHSGFVGTTTVYSIVLKKDDLNEYKYVLALLNSVVLEYFHKRNTIPQASGFYRYQALFIEQLPIFNATREQQSPIIELVDCILSVKHENPQADTSELERKIDRLVYELYGLTEEEIAVVEGKNEKK